MLPPPSVPSPCYALWLKMDYYGPLLAVLGGDHGRHHVTLPLPSSLHGALLPPRSSKNQGRRWLLSHAALSGPPPARFLFEVVRANLVNRQLGALVSERCCPWSHSVANNPCLMPSPRASTSLEAPQKDDCAIWWPLGETSASES